MWIKQVEIENFKSFYKTQTLTFEPGFNLILGANNSGKSTVLQALDLTQVPAIAHRSVASAPTRTTQQRAQPRSVVAVSMSPQEFRQMSGTGTWYLPIRASQMNALTLPDLQAGLMRLLNGPDVVVEYERSNTPRIKFSGEQIETEWSVQGGSEASECILVDERDDGPSASSIQRMEGIGSIFEPIRASSSQRMYRFEASRSPAPTARLAANGLLLPNASNLASCINHLSSNDPEGHRQLCEWTQRVLPNVHWLLAPPIDDMSLELRCWQRPHAERRDDLVVPLNQGGSGVGNVVAALYVVLTARTPQVICIDEINQFLHPKALRELLNILAIEGKQHQYILTAHSAEVISAVKASTVTMLTLKDGVTTVRQTDHAGLAKLRDGFADLGIRATEMHGRDHVLWVEGQTEELVLPTLLRHFCPEYAAGTAVLRVHDTGLFDKSGLDPIRALGIHARLTEASALVPPMIAILLDREKRSRAERKRLEEDKRGRLRFLPRRMLENFLLHPTAIAAALKDLGEDVETERVAQSLSAAASVQDLCDSDLESVDGTKLLKTIFAEISQARHEFKKTRDIPNIVDWLLENEPTFLKPLGVWLQTIMNEATNIPGN